MPHRHVRRSAAGSLLSGVEVGSLNSHCPSLVARPEPLFITQGAKIGWKAGVEEECKRQVTVRKEDGAKRGEGKEA